MIFEFLKGAAVGVAIAAPVGPVGLMCIRRALADGAGAAFVAGLGAALADTIYGGLGAFGVTLAIDFLLAHVTWLKIGGGLFMMLFGVRVMTASVEMTPTPRVRIGYLKDFATTFFVTLTNPATILGFMAIFAAMGALDGSQKAADLWTVTAGVFVGSAGWWLTLAAAGGAARNRFHPVWLTWMNRAMGAAMALFGIGVLGSLAV